MWLISFNGNVLDRFGLLLLVGTLLRAFLLLITKCISSRNQEELEIIPPLLLILLQVIAGHFLDIIISNAELSHFF